MLVSSAESASYRGDINTSSDGLAGETELLLGGMVALPIAFLGNMMSGDILSPPEIYNPHKDKKLSDLEELIPPEELRPPRRLRSFEQPIAQPDIAEELRHNLGHLAAQQEVAGVTAEVSTVAATAIGSVALEGSSVELGGDGGGGGFDESGGE